MLLFATLTLFLLQEPVDSAVQVDYVVLDLCAFDANGQLVTDLRQDEFKIRDGRDSPKPTFFQTCDLRPTTQNVQPNPAVTTDQTAAAPETQQTLILLLDFSGQPRAIVEDGFAKLFVLLEKLRPRTDIQFFAFSMELGKVSEGFTTDATLLIEDLELLRDNLLDQPPDPNQLSPYAFAELDLEMARCFGSTSPRLVGSANDGAGLIKPCLEDQVNRFSKKQADQSLLRIQILEKFINFLGQAPGLKNVFLVSPGWSYQPGEAARSLARAYFGLRNQNTRINDPDSAPTAVALNPTGPFAASHFQMEMPTRTNQDLSFHYQRLAHLALRNRVVVHTFFQPTPNSGADEGTRLAHSAAGNVANTRAHKDNARYLEEGLASLAEVSGGHHQAGTAFTTGIADTLQRNQFLYQLAYPAPEGKPGQFREVRVRCTRPGVKVQHRTGYFSRPQKKASKD